MVVAFEETAVWVLTLRARVCQISRNWARKRARRCIMVGVANLHDRMVRFRYYLFFALNDSFVEAAPNEVLQVRVYALSFD